MAQLGLDRDTIIQAGLKWLPVFDRFLVRCSTIADKEILAADLFPWSAELEGHWQAIRAEADVVLRDRGRVPPVRTLSRDHEQIAVDDRWRAFILWGYGLRWERNCERCPETARLLEGIPGLLTAFFSVLQAGAHIPRHTGPTKSILTAHLGLKVPANPESCRIQVGDSTVVWREGHMLIFDDMYPHEIWNDSGEDRVVLLLHIKRPLRFPGSLLRDLFFAALRRSPFVQDGLRNLKDWEKTVDRPAGAA